MEITPDRQLLAAAGNFILYLFILHIQILLLSLFLLIGFQHIRMYDLNSSNPNPVLNYEGISKNITGVGFHEDGKWMFTCGEDCSARVWDLR